jgi:hypothetical protein
MKAKILIAYYCVISQRNIITSAHVIPVWFRTKTFSLENVSAGDSESKGNSGLFSLWRKKKKTIGSAYYSPVDPTETATESTRDLFTEGLGVLTLTC